MKKLLKKSLKGTAEFIGMALVLAGLVVCMCETKNLDKQLVMLGIGSVMIVSGAVVSILVNGGEKNEFPG